MILQSHSAGETRRIGASLARQLRANDVVLLLGDMGVGKSELTRGIARGLGVTGYVTSPTFTILQVHEEGRLPLYHFDWYRLESAEELYELAMDEYLQNRRRGGGGMALPRARRPSRPAVWRWRSPPWATRTGRFALPP